MSFVFQKIKNQLHDKLPFVCYCKPNSDKMVAIFQKNDSLFELNDKESGFAFVSFDGEKRYLIPEKESDVYFETVSNSDYIFENNFQSEVDENDKNSFINLVENGVNSIQNGDFQKVVLSRKETITIENFDLELVFNKLVFNYKTAFKYCFYHPKIGFWVGATPEQFLKIEENLIKTVALAGTQLNTGYQDFDWTEKEINEQQIVTDYIVKNLKLYSNDIVFSKPYNFQAGKLIHIKTDIEARFASQNKVSEIINLLHPTPAVCGFPKEEAKQFIMENESYEREFYAGFLGEWNKDFLSYKEHQSDLFVNLRCMKINKNNVDLFIGCGITNESIPENEFVETVNKATTMKRVL